MPDENVTQPAPATEPVQTTDQIPAPIIDVQVPEPTQSPITEPVVVPKPKEPAEIEMPEPVEQTTPTTQPQTVSAPVETKTEQKQPEPQVIEKIVYKEDPGIIRRLLDKAKSKLQERKQKKLDKIMSLFTISPQISSKDVQKLLRTSKRSATRYLDQLEKEQKIIQHGKIGHGVLYTKKP